MVDCGSGALSRWVHHPGRGFPAVDSSHDSLRVEYIDMIVDNYLDSRR